MAVINSSVRKPPAGESVISKELSQAIERMRFPLAVAVVYIHAADMAIWLPGGPGSSDNRGQDWPSFLIQFFSEVLARIAVPAFFLVSGFLLCASRPTDRCAWQSKLKSRVRTLLIPFLFWNALMLLLYAGGQIFEPTKRFFSGRFLPIGQATFRDYANALLGFDGMPINPPLWFVRDLLILVLIAPMLVFVARRWSVPLLLALLLQWLGLFPDAWRLPVISTEAILFFTLGIILAYRSPTFQLPRNSFASLVPFGYFLSGLVEAYVVSSGTGPVPLLHQFNIVVGICAAFIVADQLDSRSAIARGLIKLAPTAFFIFAAHSPLLGLIRKLLFFAIHPESSWMKFVWLYCMGGLLALSGCLGLFLMLQRFWPEFLYFSTGLRRREQIQ